MRRQAKASTAGSNMRRPRLLVGFVAVLAVTLALGVGLANAVAPVVSVEDADNVGYTTADVKGTVNPEGQSTTWRFQYVTEAKFQENLANTLPGFDGATTGPEGSTESEETLERQLTDLAPDTTYHLRLWAENVDGQSEAVAASTFTTEEVAKPSVTIEPVTAITATSAHFSGLVNPNAPGDAEAEAQDSAFDTSWFFTCAPGCTQFGGTVAADDDPHAVSADVQLDPSTEYTITLHAKSKGGEETAQTSFETDSVEPEIGYNASAASEGKAILSGWVNPHNTPTDYHFEYGSADCASSPCVAMPTQVASTGNEPVFVSQAISGLAANTTYHYRLVASNSVGALVAPGRTVSTETGLPEDRAWEMVSPGGGEKQGADILISSSRVRAASTGEAASFSTQTAFGADVKNSPVAPDYIARRLGTPGTQGWTTHAVTPYQQTHTFEDGGLQMQARYLGDFSADLTHGVFLAKSPLTEEDPSVDFAANLYLRDDLTTPGSGHYRLMTRCPACTVPFTEEEYLQNISSNGRQPFFAGASADFSKVFFESKIALTDEGEANGQRKVYEYTPGSPGALRLVGVLPDSSCASPPCAAESSSLGLAGQNVQGARYRQSANPVSTDGSRYVFTSPVENRTGECAGGSVYRYDGSCSVYLRDDRGTPSSADDTTTEASASERSVPDPGGQVRTDFEIATPGVDAQGNRVPERVFFLSAESLTDDAPLDSTPKLYRYTDGEDPDSETNLVYIAAPINSVLDASDDGSYVYFASREQLNSSPPVRCNSRPNSTCVFAWHDDGQGAPDIHFVARVVPGKEADLNEFPLSIAANANTDYGHTARASADGTKLAFITEGLPEVGSAGGSGGAGTISGPTGYDHGRTSVENRECLSNQIGGGCQQAYLYDATANGGAGTISCMSCRPDGVRASAARGASFYAHEATGAAGVTMHDTTYFTPDGRLVFFTTGEPLVPTDVNGKADVYAYETRSGQVRLLSSGVGARDSFFMDASPEGEDVFFITGQRLLNWDVDGNQDLYDARVSGGFAERAPVPGGCEGDACQPAPAAPNDPTPGSSSFSGPASQKAHRKRHHRKRSHRKRHHRKRAQGKRAANRNAGGPK